jgi:hypothetical protein
MVGSIAIAGPLILLRTNLARRTLVPSLLRSAIGFSGTSRHDSTIGRRTVWRNVSVTYDCRLAAPLLCPMLLTSAGLTRLRLRAAALLIVVPTLSERGNRKNSSDRKNSNPCIHAHASSRARGHCTLSRWSLRRRLPRVSGKTESKDLAFAFLLDIPTLKPL